MSQPARRSSPALVVLRTFAGVVAVLGSLVMLGLVWLVVGARLSSDPATDPHGYTVIFGALLTAGIGLVTMMVAPLAAPRRWWGRAALASVLTYGVLIAIPSVVWLTG